MMASSHKEHYARLIKISQMLSNDDLRNLTFACGDVLPSAAAEKVSAGIDLFRELKQRGYLSPSNYDYLKEQLAIVGRDDLASMLPDPVHVSDEKSDGSYGCSVCCTRDSPGKVIPASLRVCAEGSGSDAAYPYRMVLMHISEQITNVEAQKLAFVMCPELRDESITPFGLVCYLSNNRNIMSASFLDSLSSSLIVIGRTDLAQLLNSSSVKATVALSPILTNIATSDT